MSSKAPTPLWLLAVLGYLLAVGIGSALPARAPEEARVAPSRYAGSLDPARMSVRELRRLPGIGAKRARAIERARRGHDPRHGPLVWTDVHGIGPRTREKIEAWFASRGADARAPLAPGPGPAAAPEGDSRDRRRGP